jgi:hypothetical protein
VQSDANFPLKLILIFNAECSKSSTTTKYNSKISGRISALHEKVSAEWIGNPFAMRHLGVLIWPYIFSVDKQYYINNLHLE